MREGIYRRKGEVDYCDKKRGGGGTSVVPHVIFQWAGFS